MPKPDLSQLKVLILDNNHHFLSMLSSILNGFGIRNVHQADNAVSALEIIKFHTIDIACVDLIMDGIDGFEFAKLVRHGSDSPNPYLPMIMITSAGTFSTVHKAINSGFDEFLSKPIKPIDVYRRIISVIEKPHSYIETENGYIRPDRRRRDDVNFKGSERRSKIEPAVSSMSVSPDETAGP